MLAIRTRLIPVSILVSIMARKLNTILPYSRFLKAEEFGLFRVLIFAMETKNCDAGIITVVRSAMLVVL